MSERIYRLMLRLYPRQFRQSYGEEALLLLQDRMRDETGGWRRARLWLDVLADLGSLHVRGYREGAVAGAAAARPGGGQALFACLEEERIEPRAMAWGGLVSLALCGTVLFGLQHGAGRLPRIPAMVPDHGIVITRKMRPRIVFSYERRGERRSSEVWLRAVVSGDGMGPPPTGKVNFLYGWNVLVSGTLVDGEVRMDAKVPAGKKLELTALYLGDGNYRPISSLEKVE
jgi:hypothetical protein